MVSSNRIFYDERGLRIESSARSQNTVIVNDINSSWSGNEERHERQSRIALPAEREGDGWLLKADRAMRG
jgi:hypothetical protein